MVPQADTNCMATITPMIIGGVTANAGITFDPNLIMNSLLGLKLIIDYVIQNAADIVMLVKHSIQQNPFVYIACDKGTKTWNKNIANYLCWFYKYNRCVKTYFLDATCCEKITDNIAKAVKHSVTKILENGNENEDEDEKLPLLLHGQCAYSGRGGTGKSLYHEL